ncbi:glycoside hydrolase family 88 protein [Clostridium sp. 19966]|uniref:glycoside hydrolase family 88/105 protein n=1 Tax=Clostridium sp. 19966 TaxID=2768166 RepID=UPI0028DDB396|nr:glycoside hydrolase family 88 protein [Clostridium sp. 19966]MDT8715663.1 glycoside hydrolase family 88 protein [Clostridium sp. 19966]
MKERALEIMKKANDYWIANNPKPGRAFWDEAVYFTGNMEAYYVTEDKRYLDYVNKWAELNQWKGAKSGDKYNWKYTYGETDEFVLFGDWQVCFQTYIDLYNLDEKKDEKKIARALEVMDYETSTEREDYLWWIDGLYMVMPVLIKVYNITGEEKYIDKLYSYYKYAKDGFFDEEDGFWYRDIKYIYPKHKSPNGKKEFWSRGSGWVFAALAKVLKDIKIDNPYRNEFIEVFKKMAKSIKRAQQAEGYWTRSIMDPEQGPGPETSGTALFTYGLAWGINNHIIGVEEYKDTLLKAWSYLSGKALQEDGKVGYVQPIGENPSPDIIVDKTSTSNFGVGVFLLACSEIAKLNF